MEQINGHATFSHISEHSFVFYKVVRNFCASTSLRDSFFRFETIQNGGNDMIMCFNQLFNFPPDILDDQSTCPTALKESMKKLVNFMKRCPQTPWHSLRKGANEKEVIVDVATKVLAHLFDVTFESGYKELVQGIPNITSKNIGIGSNDTFHGTPDLRVLGCNIITTELPVDDTDEGVNSSSDNSAINTPSHDRTPTPTNADSDSGTGGSTLSLASNVSPQLMLECKAYFEGKRFKENIHQLVATSVTCSFTYYNTGSTSLAPTVLMNHNAFRVCMYDCVADLLLISDPYNLYDTGRYGSKTVSPSAVLFLYIIVNYRHFINKVTDPVFASYKSTILTRLAADYSLHYFQTIKDCDLYWPDTSVKSQQRPRKVIAVGEAGPPPKRPNLTVTP